MYLIFVCFNFWKSAEHAFMVELGALELDKYATTYTVKADFIILCKKTLHVNFYLA